MKDAPACLLVFRLLRRGTPTLTQHSVSGAETFFLPVDTFLDLAATTAHSLMKGHSHLQSALQEYRYLIPIVTKLGATEYLRPSAHKAAPVPRLIASKDDLVDAISRYSQGIK